MSVQVPESFICPITHDIMTDPYINKEGHSFEKVEILKWLEIKQTSPVTQNPLSPTDIFPNRSLKDAIEEFKKNNPTYNLPPQKVPASETKTIYESLSLAISDKDDVMQISLTASEGTTNGSDICCVIDVSGSMSEEVTVKDENGKEISNGFTKLDLAKHALRVIAHGLTENDRASLVSFSDTARKLCCLTPMDSDGKKMFLDAIDELYPDGYTNMWDGMKIALDIMKTNSGSNRNSKIFFLTDGYENVIPPRGTIPSLNQYFDTNGSPCTVDTFSFGYNIDTKILMNIAGICDGVYAFIPDASLVGTVFINATSNFLTTAATNIKINIELNDLSSLDESYINKYKHTKTDWGYNFTFGSLGFGQSKNILFPKKNNSISTSDLTCTTTYTNVTTNTKKTQCAAHDITNSQHLKNMCRLHMVNVIYIVLNYAELGNFVVANDEITKAIDSIKKINSTDNKYFLDLCEDLGGQVKEALSSQEAYKKWGQHYLPSLAQAHLWQICNNFKDPGVQHYASKQFESMRDKLEKIFVELPPMKPSRLKAHHAKTTNMKSYYNQRGGCFHGSSFVHMADGDKKRVDLVQLGDKLITPSGKIATVTHVVVQKTDDGFEKMVHFSSRLLITPYHPIFFSGKWQFPIDVAPPSDYTCVNCDNLYNFVLDSEHVIIVNDFQCCTLGHGLKGSVIEHNYLGSHKIIEDLNKIKKDEHNKINIKGFVRDDKTRMICGIQLY